MSALSGSHSPGKKRKAINVILLNGEHFCVFVDVKSKFQDVFNQVATHLSLRETEYFGLAYRKDGEYQFVSLDDKIHKQAPKGWKSGPGEGFDGHGHPFITLYFRVQFYVDQVVLLREKVTRHLYYLQLKENVLNYKQVCSEEKYFQIAAYALQADYGNYRTASIEIGDYFDPREYFPAWMVEKRGVVYLVENTPVVHRDLHNVPRPEAEWRFIKEASSPVAHNLHFYRLKKRKTDKTWNSWLGICAKGIEIYEDMEDGFKDLISTFLWPDIGKLTFDKKKFEIRSVGSPSRKFTYFTDSDVKSKFLLSICRNTHMFQMAIQPKLMEIRHLDAEDKRRYRESYIYSDTRDLVTNGGPFKNLSPRSKSAAGSQRYSMVSDVSSNTTSGIASDKMTISFDDSDEPGREIMIDTPPRSGSRIVSRSPQFGQLGAHGNVSTLPAYKPTPIPGANRSPVLGNKDFQAYTFPSNRTPTHQNQLFHNRPCSSNVPSSSGGSDQSAPVSLGAGFRSQLQQQQQVHQQQQPHSSGLYSPILPSYPAVSPQHTSPVSSQKEKSSRPTSRSASRKDSFKEILAQLQVHKNEVPGASLQPQMQGAVPVESLRASNLVSNVNMQNIPLVHLDNIENQPNIHAVMDKTRTQSDDYTSAVRSHRSYGSDDGPRTAQSIVSGDHSRIPVSFGSADHGRTQRSFGSDVSNQSSLVASTSTVMSFGDGQSHHIASISSDSYGSGDMKLKEAEEKYLSPAVFTDGHALLDIPAEPMHLQSQTVADQALAQFPDSCQTPEQNEGQVDDSDDDDSNELSSSGGKKSKPTHITVQNQKEILHPELEEIRGQSHAFSLPFITALCNDKSLMPLHSHSGSLVGSYDSSTICSTDSRLSRLSQDVDPRRFSASFPSNSGTMLSVNSHRPFSWHSESFDLDAQLLPLYSPPAVADNHRSVPQNLSAFTTASASSWTHAIAYSMPFKQSDRYSPELIASQLMIPPKISSGGHNTTEGNMRHKTLKENVGIA